jgi:hypothetical protein
MVSVLTKSSLTPARRRLVERLQQLNFGRVEGLLVRGGEPVFGPPTRVVREIKFGGENAPRPERGLGDFLVKAQVAELLRCLSEIGDGVIDVLEVKHGLPFRLILAEAPDHAA